MGFVLITAMLLISYFFGIVGKASNLNPSLWIFYNVIFCDLSMPPRRWQIAPSFSPPPAAANTSAPGIPSARFSQGIRCMGWGLIIWSLGHHWRHPINWVVVKLSPVLYRSFFKCPALNMSGHSSCRDFVVPDSPVTDRRSWQPPQESWRPRSLRPRWAVKGMWGINEIGLVCQSTTAVCPSLIEGTRQSEPGWVAGRERQLASDKTAADGRQCRQGRRKRAGGRQLDKHRSDLKKFYKTSHHLLVALDISAKLKVIWFIVPIRIWFYLINKNS